MKKFIHKYLPLFLSAILIVGSVGYWEYKNTSLVFAATFGNSGTSGFGPNSLADYMWLTPATSGSDASGASLTKLTLRVNNFGTSGTHNFKAIITDSSLNILSNGISSSVAVSQGTTAQFDATFSTPPILNASTQYYLGIITDSSVLGPMYDILAVTSKMDSTNSYSSPISPTDATNRANQSYEIFGTYTPTGGGATPKPQMILFQ